MLEIDQDYVLKSKVPSSFNYLSSKIAILKIASSKLYINDLNFSQF